MEKEKFLTRVLRRREEFAESDSVFRYLVWYECPLLCLLLSLLVMRFFNQEAGMFLLRLSLLWGVLRHENIHSPQLRRLIQEQLKKVER